MLARRAFTMIELIVLLAIIGIIACLCVVAIVRVRESAVCTQSRNNQRQIIIAIHDYAAMQNGDLPVVDGFGANNHAEAMSFYGALYDYFGVGDSYLSIVVSPADPTVQQTLAAGWRTVVSYGANARVFVGSPRIPETFSDGASNTIALAEHYGKCGEIIL